MLTLLIIAMMSIYASLKLDELIKRNNPNVSKTEETAGIGDDEKLDLDKAGLRFAFSARSFDY